MDSVRSGPYGQIFRPVRQRPAQQATDRFITGFEISRWLDTTQHERAHCRTTLSLGRLELVTTGPRVTTQKELS